jgi:L-threonylcarbamoyladenylate synthase
MPEVFDITDPDQLVAGLRHARMAIGRKQLVVFPADTSYALAANAFSPASVMLLREVKGWTTPIPPQVLLPGIPTLTALAAEVAEPVEALAKAFWPGGLTLIVPAGESLQWDLGDNKGTVSLRMPADQAARELLADTGPLAVTQATPVGQAIASDLDAVVEAFSDQVAVYLTRGQMDPTPPSTVVDATGLAHPEGRLRILREGAVDKASIVDVVGIEWFEGPVVEESQPGD